MANPGTRVDAFPAFHFEVDIGGTSYPFRSCTGLSSETKVYEVEEGGVNGYVHKLVGPSSFPNLVLRQGFCNPSSPLYALYQNFASSESGKKRFDGFVRQIGPNGTSAKWVFKQGWITKWSGPELDATKNEVSIESIEIVHEGLQLVGPTGTAVGAASAGAGTAGATGATGATSGVTGSTPASKTTTSGFTGGVSASLFPTSGGKSAAPTSKAATPAASPASTPAASPASNEIAGPDGPTNNGTFNV
jgi:phage tail-like protein